MSTKGNRIAVLAIVAFVFVCLAGLSIRRSIINAATDSSTGNIEICDNGIDDNNDGITDGCWDPGDNYQITGKSYYVSTDGSDLNSGTQTAPFKTIAKAAALAQAGDGIFINSGTYSENIKMVNAGTPDKPIIVKGIGATRPVIRYQQDGYARIVPKSNTIIENLKTDGIQTVTSGGHSAGGYGVWVNNVKNVLVRNCEFTQHERAVFAENGDRMIVRDSKAYLTEWGFVVGRDNNQPVPADLFTNTLFENCEAADTAYKSFNNTDGFGIEGGASHHVIRNCKSHGFTDAGYDIKTPVLIENSIAYNNDQNGVKIWRDGLVRNTISYNNKYSNYVFGGITPNWKLINSISYNGTVYFEKRGESSPSLSASSIKVSHNIFDKSEIVDEIGGSLAKADHNIYFGPGISSAPESTSKVLDPKFKNADLKDFHLLLGSPAIDSGVSTVSQLMGTKDFDGNLRKSGQAVDIGPYEYGSVSGGATATTSSTTIVLATPTANPTLTSTATAIATPRITTTATTNVVNNPPATGSQETGVIAIKPVAPKFIAAGKRLNLQLNATGASGNLKYSKVSMPKGSTVTSAGAFSWKPSIFAAGSYNVQIRATDSSGDTGSISFDIKVLRLISTRENREINLENRQNGEVSFQLCRNPEYSSKYKEVFSFSDGSPYVVINEAGRSRCSDFYLHQYKATGDYLLTLYLCEKKNGKLVNCFPNTAQNISK